MFSLPERQPAASSPRRRPTRRRLHLEALEGRDLMTALPVDFGATITSPPVAMNGALYFTASDVTHGDELWRSDGTAAGTMLVMDSNPGSAASAQTGLTNVNGPLFFMGFDPAHGMELWKSDGTSNGMALVSDINPGTVSSIPSFLTNVNGTLFFSA